MFDHHSISTNLQQLVGKIMITIKVTYDNKFDYI